MINQYIPEQGDLVFINFDPSSGHEIGKRRPAFVVSKKLFNQSTGFAIFMPVTSTLRNLKLEVHLNSGNKINGVILPHQMRSLDYLSRQVEFVEKAPQDAITRALQIAKLIIS